MMGSTMLKEPYVPSAQNVGGQRSLRILQVASCMPRWGGAESHLLSLSRCLTERGHRVSVLCQPGSYVEAQASNGNLPVLHATVNHQSDFEAFVPLLKAMRFEAWDVVHVHWETDYLFPPLVARLVHVPAVMMSHHSPYPLKRQAWKQRLWRGSLFDKVIALSESVRQMLLAHQMPAQKVVTVHHGTDTVSFRKTTLDAEAVRREWNLPPGKFVVGVVGRVSPEKGIDVFLRSLALLNDVPIHGVVVGDGPQIETLKELSSELGIADRVTWAGFRSDVNNAINALDALVLASTWDEPCAAVVQQAMALSKPVIGTATGGTPEMVDKENTGIVVPPGAAEAMGQAIRRVATDPALCQRMGRAGQVRAEQLFTLQGMTDRIESLYRDVLAKKGRQPL